MSKMEILVVSDKHKRIERICADEILNITFKHNISTLTSKNKFFRINISFPKNAITPEIKVVQV